MPRLFAALLMGLMLSTGAARAHCDQQGSHQHSDSDIPAQRQR
ncbi:hypothetical protein [Cyanobium sp. ATX 6A2]|jgi:hypothetical protein|nr:hypothetical protein [Cyanobium sp. ATX 6A2]